MGLNIRPFVGTQKNPTYGPIHDYGVLFRMYDFIRDGIAAACETQRHCEFAYYVNMRYGY